MPGRGKERALVGRKKRKKQKTRKRSKSGESRTLFNPAFHGKIAFRTEPAEGTEALEKQGVAPGPRPPDENRVFLEAMADVIPMGDPRKRSIREPNVNMRPAHPAPDEELEAMAHLSDLVSGTAEFDITFSDEYIEGSVQGLSRKLMQKLKRGKFPVQDHVDLHGLTKREAEISLRQFLLKSYRLGLRCVLVVHGRGLNSDNHIPVLKERLPLWLRRGRVKKIVLAFSTARHYDGGTGAIYVLLKRSKVGL